MVLQCLICDRIFADYPCFLNHYIKHFSHYHCVECDSVFNCKSDKYLHNDVSHSFIELASGIYVPNIPSGPSSRDPIVIPTQTIEVFLLKQSLNSNGMKFREISLDDEDVYDDSDFYDFYNDDDDDDDDDDDNDDDDDDDSDDDNENDGDDEDDDNDDDHEKSTTIYIPKRKNTENINSCHKKLRRCGSNKNISPEHDSNEPLDAVKVVDKKMSDIIDHLK